MMHLVLCGHTLQAILTHAVIFRFWNDWESKVWCVSSQEETWGNHMQLVGINIRCSWCFKIHECYTCVTNGLAAPSAVAEAG